MSIDIKLMPDVPHCFFSQRGKENIKEERSNHCLR